jgi:hypothetical protein
VGYAETYDTTKRMMKEIKALSSRSDYYEKRTQLLMSYNPNLPEEKAEDFGEAIGVALGTGRTRVAYTIAEVAIKFGAELGGG